MKKLYAPILIIGGLIMFGGIFQNSLWFDEAYSVGLMTHSLTDVIKWAVWDVHPPLYYVLLKLFSLVFGTSMPALRAFSVIGAILFASLGATHIRRDFGDKVGLWFSFCAMFFVCNLNYALQIRMYTWLMYFVGLTSVYAYRYSMSQNRNDRVLFIIFSICSAYTHYFGLFTVAAINLALLVWDKKQGRELKAWFVNGAVQIVSYIPGAVVFLIQIALNGASWMLMEWPDFVFDLSSYHVLGDVLKVFVSRNNTAHPEYLSIPYAAIGGLFTLLFVMLFVLLFKRLQSDYEQKNAVKASLWMYFGVIIFAVTVSLFRIIYYIRYTLAVLPFLVFVIAWFLATNVKKWKNILASVLIVSIFAVQAVGLYDLMYDKSADNLDNYFEDRLEDDDIFLFDGTHFVMTVTHPENRVFYYNGNNWGVDKTFRAFGPKVEIVTDTELDAIKNHDGTVWVVGRGDFYNSMLGNNDYLLEEETVITMTYHDQSFEIARFESK